MKKKLEEATKEIISEVKSLEFQAKKEATAEAESKNATAEAESPAEEKKDTTVKKEQA